MSYNKKKTTIVKTIMIMTTIVIMIMTIIMIRIMIILTFDQVV